MKLKSIALTVTVAIASCGPVYAVTQITQSTLLFTPQNLASSGYPTPGIVPSDNSVVYSPAIMHKPGWGSFLIYHCSNGPSSYPNQQWGDTVWRAETWSTTGDSGWTGHLESVTNPAPRTASPTSAECSPGVDIDPGSNWWHMYMVTSPQLLGNDPLNNVQHIYHTSAQAPGTNWNPTPDEVVLLNPRTGAKFADGTYYDTPQPTYAFNWLFLSAVAGDVGGEGNGCGQRLRMFMYDGLVSGQQRFHQIAEPYIQRTPGVNDNRNISHGRITLDNGTYYAVYSKATICYAPPTRISLATSTDLSNWTFRGDLVTSSGNDSSTWDGKYVFSPSVYINGSELWLYYAGMMSGDWVSNSSIGMRKYLLP